MADTDETWMTPEILQDIERMKEVLKDQVVTGPYRLTARTRSGKLLEVFVSADGRIYDEGSDEGALEEFQTEMRAS